MHEKSAERCISLGLELFGIVKDKIKDQATLKI